MSHTSNTKKNKNPQVLMKTSLGDIKLELFENEAPITVKNFLQYVADKHYDSTIFHRVIDGFMIQGGGFDAKLQQKKTRKSIENEATNELSNERGTIAMARTSDVHSATAQFFINVTANPFLDFRDESPQGFGYCVFGRVIDGLDVVDKIRVVKTGTVSHFSDVPKTPVEIISVKEIS